MSDHSKATGCSDIFRGSGATRPQDPHQLQRMGHWKYINSILASSVPRSPADNADFHEECARRGQNLLAQFWKSKETGNGNGQMPEHVSSPMMSDPLYSVGGMIAGKGTTDVTRDCRRKEKARAFEAERMILSKASVCRMERSCVDWKNVNSAAFLHSGVVSSEWLQYAELDVNQKTQSLVRSKRKYGCCDASLDKGQLQTTQSELKLTPDELKSMPEDFQFQAEYKVQLSKLYRLFEKKRLHHSGSLQNDWMVSSSGHELGGSSRMQNVGPSIFTGDEKNCSSFGVAYKEKLANHVGTACLGIVAHRERGLPEGVSSARSDDKDFTGMQHPRKSESACQDFESMQNPRKPESTSALQMKEAIISNQETKLLDTSLDFVPCINTAETVEPKGLSLPRTDTMEVGHIISEVEKLENSGSSHQPENRLGSEVGSRWVKRLKVNSDSVVIGTRDYNTEDVLTTRRVHKLFSRVMNYTRSNAFTLAKCLQECQQFQKTMLLLCNNDSPVESLKESQPWIQRWCQKGEETAYPKSRKPMEVLCEPDKTKALPESLEGKLFPSLAAMALMGKAINNFRPCEFRRRGSSWVWHTEGF